MLAPPVRVYLSTVLSGATCTIRIVPTNAGATARREASAEIRRRLLEGELLPNVAAVAVQSINTDIRAVGAAMKAKEQEELVERLESLEEALEQWKGEHRYGA
jgi:hypothetical protein